MGGEGVAGYGHAEAERGKSNLKGRNGATDPKAGQISDQEGKLAALNQSGAFLHIAAIQAAKASGFLVQTELPVRVAPFVSDPMAQEGAASWRTGPDGSWFRNRTKMQAAIAKSQDGSQGKQRTIDVTAMKNSRGKSYAFSMEVKRQDPHYVDWVFIDQNLESRRYFTTAVSTKEDRDALPLMKMPRHGPEGTDLHVQKK